MPQKMISILMATYNGEAYLSEQLDSLFQQTNQDFELIVQDDCSTDGTAAILKEYENRYPDRMHVFVNVHNSGSAKANFMQLMTECRNDYVMLCDQDDIWKPEKIDISIQAMRGAESQYGKEMPILVHTDLIPVDKNLTPIAPSFRKMEQIRFGVPLRQLLVQNSVTGCTVLFNRALAEHVTAVPDMILMHDWWLALLAAALGKIIPLPNEQTVLYRQHNSNQLGAVKTFSFSYFKVRFDDPGYAKRLRIGTYRQAGALKEIYGKYLPKEMRDMLAAYSNSENRRKLERGITLIRYGIYKHTLPRIVGQLLNA